MVRTTSLFFFFLVVALGACKQKQSYKPEPTKVNNATLIIATKELFTI